ncbi:MAG TPA: glycosyltransferase [Solirubrobacteraceae bacterium]|nr:glycosyltransferase [Solirubrobacteraceae bacterium]
MTAGAETVATRIALGLDPTRFESIICSTRPSARHHVKAARAAGVEVLELGRRSKVDVWRWRPFVRLLHSGKVDVVHAHKFGSNLWAALLKPRSRLPVLLAHEHSWSYEGTLRRLVDRDLIARRADAVVAVSPTDRLRMIELERIPPGKVVYVPNGIPDGSPGDPEFVRRELGLTPSDSVVGTVCGLRPEKELETALRALARLAPHRPGLRFLVVGDGLERPRLERLASELGVPATFLGHRSNEEVPDLLAAMDVLVLSSRFEGMPLAVLEWMAAGKAIVASRVGGIPTMVEEGKEALLVPPRDHVSFADAIGRLLDDPAERKRLGKAAQRRQRAQFRFDQTIAQLESLYETLYADAKRDLGSRRSRASAANGFSRGDG